MRVRLATILSLTLLGSFSAPPAAAQLVGSYVVNDGPAYEQNPPVYSCLDACALLFGGAGADYSCSTNAETIDHMAWGDVWGDPGTYCSDFPIASESFVVGTNYDCQEPGCSFSAYVADHFCMNVNYCFVAVEEPPDGECGNGTVDEGESCDDGNTADGDCCSSSCSLEPAGSSCTDGDACNGEETCSDTGECLAGDTLECDDGDPCTRDSCDAVSGCMVETGPLQECTAASSAELYVDHKLKVVEFEWTGAAAKSEFGNPLKDDDTAMCVYANGTSLGVLSVDGGRKCGKRPCWKSHSSGYSYVDLFGKSDGVRGMKLKAGSSSRGRISLLAFGRHTPSVSIPSGSATIVTQIVNDSGSCFEATFAPHEQKKSKHGKLKAKHKKR
jgi:cysteine-rich repeat protein